MIVNMLNETEQWTAKVEITSGIGTYKFMYHSCMINYLIQDFNGGKTQTHIFKSSVRKYKF